MREQLRARRANPETHKRDLEVRRKRYASKPEVRVQAKLIRDRYRKHLAQATPRWADHHEIRRVYEKATALGLEVDHIVPLRGRNVSGLHVSWNLQVLSAADNRRKSNRLVAA